MADQSMAEFISSVPIEVSGEPFNFELRPSSHNGKVIEALDFFSKNPDLAAAGKKLDALFEPVNLTIESTGFVLPKTAKPKSLADQIGPGRDNARFLDAENRDNLKATTYAEFDAIINNPSLSERTIKRAQEVFAAYDVRVVKELNGGDQEPIARPKLTTNRKLVLAGLNVLLAACAVLPVSLGTVPVERERTVQPADLPTVKPTATETAKSIPTEVANPLEEMAESIPAEWGTITIDAEGSATYFSPEGVIAGSEGAPAKYDSENGWITLAVKNEATGKITDYPIFAYNETTSEWEKTGIEFVDVLKPLFDSEGAPMRLTYEFLGNPEQSVSGFFVANGESYIENNIQYRPIAASIDGNPEGGLMNTNLRLPNVPGSIAYYKDGIYIQGFQGSSNQNLESPPLKKGDVFFAQFTFDFPGELENRLADARKNGKETLIMVYSNMLRYGESVRLIFDNLIHGEFDQVMLERIDMWYVGLMGISG